MKLSVVLILVLTLIATLPCDEGMYPLSEIHKLDLRSKGFLIDANTIYKPGAISLIDGIINLSGCTGSFVSANGLILTNHHCAFRAIQANSTSEKDFLTDGFVAQKLSEELPAPGYRVRITESYRDVSRDVLKVVKKKMDYANRTKAIEKRIKEIVLRTEKKNPGKRATVSEMFPGKTYVLFIYTYLRDIRLVYAPPQAVGNFGGETDNWMWPRHTGDFSFMRAYVAPDGRPAPYAKENVPYKPKKNLKVAPEGVKEGDLIFILGYPGRTYRHKTSHYIDYLETVRMPVLVKLYQWQISEMKRMSKKDRTTALKLAPWIKGLSNRMKNYMGKLKGLKGLKLVQKKQAEEEELAAFIGKNSQLQKKYGDIFPKVAKIYREIKEQAPFSFAISSLGSRNQLLGFAHVIYEASIELKKKETSRKSAYMKRNLRRTIERIRISLNSYYEPADRLFLREALLKAIELKDCKRIPVIDALIKGGNPESSINTFLDKAFAQTRLKDPKFITRAFSLSTKQLQALNDPFIKLAQGLYPVKKKIDETNKRQKGILDELHARLIDIKKMRLGKGFIPDANGTLRLTFGHIQRYSPADGVIYTPITTLRGVINKHTGTHPFNAPQKLLSLYEKRDFGPFMHPQLRDVPVNILYSADTTGGNSGSPVLNARGQLIGLNFDRAFEATINDFAWNIDYSRSIGVDIRYILWFMNKYSNVKHLLKEMEVL
jgi:hypothetical protein